MCRCVLFQSERSSRQSLQFLHPAHQNISFISVSGHFCRIICLFFMARIQFLRKNSALTACFHVRQPPYSPFVLSSLPANCHHVCRVDTVICNMQMDVFSQTGIVELVKIKLGQRNVWRYSRKFRIYDVQVNFAIPPIFYFSLWLGKFSSL